MTFLDHFMKARALVLHAVLEGVAVSSVPGIWRQWAPRAQSQAMKGGHFFPEENADDTAVLIKQFLSAECS